MRWWEYDLLNKWKKNSRVKKNQMLIYKKINQILINNTIKTITFPKLLISNVHLKLTLN